MKKYLKKIVRLWANICKNTIHLSYKSKYDEERMLVRQLQYEKQQLINRNEKLRLQVDLLSK